MKDESTEKERMAVLSELIKANGAEIREAMLGMERLPALFGRKELLTSQLIQVNIEIEAVERAMQIAVRRLQS